MARTFKSFTRDSSGATAIEYALIAGCIALVIVAAVTLIGTTLSTRLSAAGSLLQ